MIKLDWRDQSEKMCGLEERSFICKEFVTVKEREAEPVPQKWEYITT